MMLTCQWARCDPLNWTLKLASLCVWWSHRKRRKSCETSDKEFRLWFWNQCCSSSLELHRQCAQETSLGELHFCAKDDPVCTHTLLPAYCCSYKELMLSQKKLVLIFFQSFILTCTGTTLHSVVFMGKPLCAKKIRELLGSFLMNRVFTLRMGFTAPLRSTYAKLYGPLIIVTLDLSAVFGQC